MGLAGRRAARGIEPQGGGEKAREDAAYGWDASPVSTARLSMELYGQIKNEDWALVSESYWIMDWLLRLWDFKNTHISIIGGAGGEGARLSGSGVDWRGTGESQARAAHGFDSAGRRFDDRQWLPVDGSALQKIPSPDADAQQSRLS